MYSIPLNVSVLTAAQLQALIIAYAGVVTICLPIIGAVAILAVNTWGKVKEAIGRLEQQNGAVVNLSQAAQEHTAAISEIATKLNVVAEKVDEATTTTTKVNE